MTLFDRRTVKREARQILAEAGNGHKKLVLIHTGALLLLNLILMLLDYLLAQKISTTGGLGGIGTRSTLATLQSGLQAAQLIVLPLWQAGYVYLTLRLSQGKSVGAKTLLGGFVRFGPVLRLLLLEFALYMAIGIACISVSYSLVMATPLATPLLELAEAAEAGTVITNEMILATAGDTIFAFVMLFAVLYFVLCAIFSYRYRLAMFSLMDDELTGAFAAMRNSRILTKGNRLRLFKLDLSFWWFYALDTIPAFLYEAVLFLPLLGIGLPIPETAVSFIGFALFALSQLALHYWRKNEVNVTYAQVYNTLMEEE